MEHGSGVDGGGYPGQEEKDWTLSQGNCTGSTIWHAIQY